MADETKSSANDDKAQDREEAGAPIKDLPQQDISTDGADQVKGGKAPKTNWDIPAGTASPSA